MGKSRRHMLVRYTIARRHGSAVVLLAPHRRIGEIAIFILFAFAIPKGLLPRRNTALRRVIRPAAGGEGLEPTGSEVARLKRT